MNVSQLYRWFLPDFKGSDSQQITKSKILVYGLLIVTIVSVVFAFINVVFDLNSDYPYGITVIIIAALLVIFKFTSSLVLIGNLLGLCISITLFSLSLKSGGIYSLDNLCLFLTPCVVFAIAGNRSGLLWAIIAISWTFYLNFLAETTNEMERLRSITLKFPSEYYLVGSLLNTIVSSLLFFLVNRQYSKLINRFRKNEKALEENNIALEDKTRKLEDAQHELKRSNTELQQYAYVTSHDLKQPVKTIQGYIGLLKNHLENNNSKDQMSDEILSNVLSSANGMDRLIKDILDYSKLSSIKSGNFKLQDLNIVINEVIQQLNHQIKENSVEIKLNDLPEASVIPVKINQLFLNLISNAIKFKADGRNPEVIVKYEDIGSHHRFVVKDNGSGIEKENQKEIFKPFTRLNEGSAIEGSGIGLASCAKIIELHKGRIWVDSTINEGSSFYFTIQKGL